MFPIAKNGVLLARGFLSWDGKAGNLESKAGNRHLSVASAKQP